MAKTVQVIPASIKPFSATPLTGARRRKVAGYARVSTDMEEQTTSYDAQLDYYTNYIKGRNDWEFAGMYSDEGISATNTKHRDGFNQMVKDALDGKIDLILTKSVSRFARNTVDSLTTVRKLKEKGVEIYFEKENIWTFDAKGELLITIMSSLAQEESRSISENTTWGKRKSFSDGKVSIPYSKFMGYDKGPNGEFVINEEQAIVVRLIFKLFLEGLSSYKIANKLMELGYKTAQGRDKWWPDTVRRMLSNEKYRGDARLQKQFTTDFLTKKRKKNEGEVPQYYVSEHHEAIIEPKLFDLVQAELEKRKKENRESSGNNIFASKIQCGDCGGWYGAKVWHSNDQYRRTIYQCNHKYKKHKCGTPHLTEDEIKVCFSKALEQIIHEKDDLIENARWMIAHTTRTDTQEQKMQEILNEMSLQAELINNLIRENARIATDQVEYQKKYDAMVEKYNSLKLEYEDLQQKIDDRRSKRLRMEKFIHSIEALDKITLEFDKDRWCCLVDRVIVYSKKDIRFVLITEEEIQVSI